MEPTTYATIDAPFGGGVDTELEVKRSRFLTRLRRVGTEEAARSVIEERRRAAWDARHHCSAFVLGATGAVARSNDDGEPAGTAGIPMLTVLQRAGLSDVVVVVTRYFGGIKLGTGGLARAYGDAAAQAVAAAGRRTVQQVRLATLTVNHAGAGRLENQLRSAAGVAVESVAYADQVRLKLAVVVDQWDEVNTLVAAASSGTARLLRGPLAWRG